MNVTETFLLAATMSAPAFFDLLGLAAFGVIFVAVVNELTASSNGKVFFDKYAQQSATMGLLLMTVSLAALTAAGFVAVSRMPRLAQWLVDPASPFIHFYAATGLGLVLGIPYVLTWRKMRSAKGVHMAFGFGAGLALLAAVSCCVAALYMLGTAAGGDAMTFTAGRLPLAADSLLWPMAAQYVLLAIGSGAGLSLVYLVLRRNKDDFGRDYYKFSLPLAAKWAAFGVLLHLMCQGWLYALLPQEARTLVMNTGMVCAWGSAVLAGLICCGLWALLSGCKAPMRMKWIAFVGAALLWVMLSLNITVSMGLLSMLQ